MNPKLIRWIIGVSCSACLLTVFIFQQVDVAGYLGFVPAGFGRFLINRSIRFILNDALVIGLIYALFVERKYIVFSVWIQLIGMICILVPYFIIKGHYPNYNGPLISYLHRLVLNPTLLLLLIPAFYYQKKSSVYKTKHH